MEKNDPVKIGQFGICVVLIMLKDNIVKINIDFGCLIIADFGFGVSFLHSKKWLISPPLLLSDPRSTR